MLQFTVYETRMVQKRLRKLKELFLRKKIVFV